MPWYRFFKRSGPMGVPAETFRHYDEASDEALELDCENWAEDMPGGHNTSYRVGYEKVDHPPLEWLRRKLDGLRKLRDRLEPDIRFYEGEIARAEKDAETETEDVG